MQVPFSCAHLLTSAKHLHLPSVMEASHAQAPLAVTKQSSDELVKELFLRAILSWPLNVNREMLHEEPFFCIRYVIELVLFELFNFSGNKYRWKNTWTVDFVW